MLDMKPRFARLTSATLLGLVSASAHCQTVLQSSTLSVTLDPTFPRVIQYTVKATGATIAGQTSPTNAVAFNGRAAKCDIAFSPSGPDQGDYRLAFGGQITATLHVTVGTEAIELRLTSVQESGRQRLHSLAFPNDALLTISSKQPGAALATTLAYVADNNGVGTDTEYIGPLSGMRTADQTANYFFASAGPIAAGVADNGITDSQRIAYRVSQGPFETVCQAWMPQFQYREIDSETLDQPFVKVMVTADRNGDGKADWQDAAIAYRDVMPRPLGHDVQPDNVADQIAMEYASGAQQPFLRILDEMKKVYLATDGLGQAVQVKGYTAEGHDQSNSDMYGHVNVRAGGQSDLNFLIDNARALDGRVGVHVNVSEVYPEARRYNPDLILRDARGNPVPGWNGLDQAYKIDKRKDAESGGLYAELDGLHSAMPNLGFLYVDTYWENGWVAYKLASKVNGIGLPLYTEGPMSLDPWTTWAHINSILKSEVMRFIWYGDRDIFADDPLLRTTKRVGFMGFEGGGDFNVFIQNLFSRNLIARYLQHFPVMRWVPGDSAQLDGGVNVVKSGNGTSVTRQGRAVAMWTGAGTQNRLFVPWDPRSESKVYVWDEVGTPQTWTLPPSWSQSGQAYLYRLTDDGRTDETAIPISGGSVTLTVAKNTPYVLYPTKQPAMAPLAWGAGGLVKDPGFDSHSLGFWKPFGEVTAVQSSDNSVGNARLLISGAGGAMAGVTQEIDGLSPGKTYAASVWVNVHGARQGTIVVQPASGAMVTNFVNDHIRHTYPSDPRSGSGYQRVKVMFDMPAGSSSALITLRGEKGSPTSSVEFDDVRVVESGRSQDSSKHWFFEDFENVDEGLGPFANCPVAQTHLSEANPPYTTDVIDGKYSLKTRNKGRVLRTTPSSLRFKPNEQYRLTVDTLTDPNVTASLSVETPGHILFQQPFPAGRGQITGDFSTGPDGETFIAIYKETHRPGDMAVLDNLAIDDIGPASSMSGNPLPDKDALPGQTAVIDEHFGATPSADWTASVSKAPGSTLGVADGALRITAHANTSVFMQHALPAGTSTVEARIDAAGDDGLSWGPGLALEWPGGQGLRIYLRNKEGGFGVDSTAGPQVRGGLADADTYDVLRIRLDGGNVIAEARTDWGDWQQIATFSRTKFPGGAPDRVLVGKMAGAGAAGDYSDLGPMGDTAVYRLRVFTGG